VEDRFLCLCEYRWSASVEQRVNALKKLEYEAIKHLKVNYYVELHALETKYQELFVPLDQRVSQRIIRLQGTSTQKNVAIYFRY